jgi:hypothetical protein
VEVTSTSANSVPSVLAATPCARALGVATNTANGTSKAIDARFAAARTQEVTIDFPNAACTIERQAIG